MFRVDSYQSRAKASPVLSCISFKSGYEELLKKTHVLHVNNPALAKGRNKYA